METATAHLRVARETRNIAALLPFYRDALGFEVIGEFHDHELWDGVMLGHKGSGYHLEFTHKAGHDAVQAPPSHDNLLVFYLPDREAYSSAVARMEGYGFASVQSINPYWDQCGKTFEDPDGYRVVFANMKWAHS